jgi:hypothetical protein
MNGRVKVLLVLGAIGWIALAAHPSDQGSTSASASSSSDSFILNAKDTSAMLAMESYRCPLISPGTELVVDQSPLFDDNICVRRKGQVDCIWTNPGWLKK